MYAITVCAVQVFFVGSLACRFDLASGRIVLLVSALWL